MKKNTPKKKDQKQAGSKKPTVPPQKLTKDAEKPEIQEAEKAKLSDLKNQLDRKLARNEELKRERDQLRAKIAAIKAKGTQEEAQREQDAWMRVEKAYAKMIKTTIVELLDVACLYIMHVRNPRQPHPHYTGRPVAEALKEVLFLTFSAVENASLFANNPEIREESLAYFQRILERERKQKASVTKRLKKETNSHSFRHFCRDAILFALYLKQNGWKRHWLHIDFPGDFRDAKNKADWRRYLRNLIPKCYESEDYPLSIPTIKGYASSRFKSQLEPAIDEILSWDEEKLSKEMKMFVFYGIEWFVTGQRKPTLDVLAEMYPGCT
jgi:hypothetical protein